LQTLPVNGKQGYMLPRPIKSNRNLTQNMATTQIPVPGIEVDDRGGDIHAPDGGHGEGAVITAQVRPAGDCVCAEDDRHEPRAVPGTVLNIQPDTSAAVLRIRDFYPGS
jgi:hypothetical protein